VRGRLWEGLQYGARGGGGAKKEGKWGWGVLVGVECGVRSIGGNGREKEDREVGAVG